MAKHGSRTIGFLGAGRLGVALARRYLGVTGVRAPLWSRRFIATNTADADTSDATACYRVAPLDEVFGQDIVVAAVPSHGLRDISIQPCARVFRGVLASAALDVRQLALGQLFPGALCIRVAPFLLPDHPEIPALIFGEGLSDAKSIEMLGTFGQFEVVANEETYETLLMFGSPVPVVLHRALVLGIREILDGHNIRGDAVALAQRLLWRGLSAYGMNCIDTPDVATATDVATPGGITEVGLREARKIAAAVAAVVRNMSMRRDALSRTGTLGDPRV